MASVINCQPLNLHRDGSKPPACAEALELRYARHIDGADAAAACRAAARRHHRHVGKMAMLDAGVQFDLVPNQDLVSGIDGVNWAHTAIALPASAAHGDLAAARAERGDGTRSVATSGAPDECANDAGFFGDGSWRQAVRPRQAAPSAAGSSSSRSNAPHTLRSSAAAGVALLNSGQSGSALRRRVRDGSLPHQIRGTYY